jgi:hypothetical protein
MRTPDGTVLTSYYRHDYVTHTDENGEHYMTDGGSAYLRRSLNKVPAEDLTVYMTDDHEANRQAFHWGTRGVNGDQPVQWKPVADLDTDHIEAILETQAHIRGSFVEELMKAELDYRNDRP